MKKFVQKWILHNLHYKIIALVIAIFVWILFTNSNDPITTYSFDTQVNVLHQEEYEEQGRYVEIEGTDDFSTLSVEVYVRARRSVGETLRNRAVSSFLNVYVDLFELESSDSNRLILHYEFSDSSVNAELYSIRNRSYLTVDVEENITIEVPVEYTITGTPANGYIYVMDDPNIVVTPSTISLTGPANQLEAVDHAQITVSVSEASANVNKTGRLVLQDENGASVTYSRDVIWSSVSEASVFIPIYTYKTVMIQPYLVGSAPSGYEYLKDIKLDVDQVSIYGPESVLNKIYNVSLPAIQLSEVTGAYEEVFTLQNVLNDLYGDDVVKLVEGQPQTVTVNFTVEQQVERVVTIATSSINVNGLPENLKLTFSSEYIDITLYGLQAEMDAFDESALTVTLRLTNMNKTAGTHTVALEVGGLGDLQYKAVTTQIVLTASEESSQTEEEEN